jgi:hypothetical protein
VERDCSILPSETPVFVRSYRTSFEVSPMAQPLPTATTAAAAAPPRRGTTDAAAFGFWNHCATSLSRTTTRAATSCTDGPMKFDSGDDDYREDYVDEYDDDDDIVEESIRARARRTLPSSQHHHQHNGGAPWPLPPQPPHQRSMRNLVDGFLSPFMNCVQPPWQACVAPSVDDWTTTSGTTTKNRTSLYQHSQRKAPSTPRSSNSTSGSFVVDSRRSNHHGNLSAQDRVLNSTCWRGGGIDAIAPSPPRRAGLFHPTTALSKTTTTTRMVPHDNDVLCGRGNNANRHAGNVFFRDLIAANKAQYATLTKKEKMMLARQIVTVVCHHTDPPGRFLGRDTVTGLWYDIGGPRSLEKTSQALREKSSAITKCSGNGIAPSLHSAPSLDEEAGGGLGEEAESESGMEIMTTSDKLSNGDKHHDESPTAASAEATNALCRASTAKMANHNRHNLIAAVPPTVVIPHHLHQVYIQSRKSTFVDDEDDDAAYSVPLESGPLLTRPYAAAAPPPLCAQVHHHSFASQQHRMVSGAAPSAAASTVSHSSPHCPSPSSHAAALARQQQQHHHHHHSHHHRPYDYRPSPHSASVNYRGGRHRIDSHQYHHHHPFQPMAPPPTPMTLSPAISPPRRSLPTFPTTTEASPHLPALVTPPSGLHDYRQPHLPHDQSKVTATTFPSFPQRHDKAAAAPAFPLDVFMNPHYSFRNETREPELPRTTVLGNPAATHERSLDGTLSPTREQQPKRQRTKEGLLNTSIESIVDVNTSGESSHGDSDGHGLEQNSLLPTSGLTEAIATQLTLDDRVIRSPSEFTQSLVGGRRRRSPLPVQPWPRPVKTSPALDISADSMDGLAALSTAAFLRLDESF